MINVEAPVTDFEFLAQQSLRQDAQINGGESTSHLVSLVQDAANIYQHTEDDLRVVALFGGRYVGGVILVRGSPL
ncbi:unnamed protein product [Echinostoma caproni]|uniref:Acetyltransferase n=1 Tax=Echinostoma caproni TaxID=27848 RepID=A0A183AZ49_9TREM|nr:unnamed protein product [Echinostoma caproni]